MGKIPILKNRDCGADEPTTAGKFAYLRRPLPVWSHLEYYVLGLLVDMPERAIRVLSEQGYRVAESDAGAEVAVDDPGQLQDLVSLLRTHGIDAQPGDAIDQVYRG